ncbi:hypothetical protein MPL3356_120099 [Mesorhizobium plurifarium]|uniref:Uncharacterized protein n=1 Tax=Mesorhizobium plurifarium TaxID=69974 RepID=A0A090DHA4_MESPL|nr:hypothetical protein MPL3356_120099 [Mesorhizobium plurifarium]
MRPRRINGIVRPFTMRPRGRESEVRYRRSPQQEQLLFPLESNGSEFDLQLRNGEKSVFRIRAYASKLSAFSYR